MRHFTILSLTLLLAFAAGGADLLAQCGPGGCPLNVPGRYVWERSTNDPDCWGLLLNGVQVGAWRRSTNTYRQIHGGNWGEASEAPVKPPAAGGNECPCCGEDCPCKDGKVCGKPNCPCVLAGAAVESDGSLNFGVNMKACQRDKRIHNGREVGKAELLQAIGKPTLPDDSGWLCLTVIGTEAERQAVLADLASAPPLTPWKERLKVHGYESDNWAVADAGFVTTGHPTIYCQAADGKVLHRQDAYRGPVELAEALRKADPDYQPANDPNLNASDAIAWLETIGKELTAIPVWVWLVVAFVIYLRFQRRENLQ